MFQEDQENAINGKEQGSVQVEAILVSATMGIKVENRHTSTLLLLSREKMVDIFRERRAPEVGAPLGS